MRCLPRVGWAAGAAVCPLRRGPERHLDTALNKTRHRLSGHDPQQCVHNTKGRKEATKEDGRETDALRSCRPPPTLRGGRGAWAHAGELCCSTRCSCSINAAHSPPSLRLGRQFDDARLGALGSAHLLRGHLRVPHEPHRLQGADEVPRGVDLPPLQAVARRVGELQRAAAEAGVGTTGF